MSFLSAACSDSIDSRIDSIQAAEQNRNAVPAPACSLQVGPASSKLLTEQRASITLLSQTQMPSKATAHDMLPRRLSQCNTTDLRYRCDEGEPLPSPTRLARAQLLSSHRRLDSHSRLPLSADTSVSLTALSPSGALTIVLSRNGLYVPVADTIPQCRLRQGHVRCFVESDTLTPGIESVEPSGTLLSGHEFGAKYTK